MDHELILIWWAYPPRTKHQLTKPQHHEGSSPINLIHGLTLRTTTNQQKREKKTLPNFDPLKPPPAILGSGGKHHGKHEEGMVGS